MASRLLRRSGVAVCLLAELIEFEPDCVFHVGVGQHFEETQVMQEAWPNVRFYGFEAHPGIYNQIKDKYPGDLMPAAVSSPEDLGKMREFWSKTNHKDGSSLYRPEGVKNVERYEVYCTTLDHTFRPPMDIIDVRNPLLWLDCEGNELAVLRGAVEFIKEVSVINVEMTASPPSAEWASPVDVHNFLIEHGFYRLWVHTQRSGSGQYDAIYVRKPYFHAHLCCCPCEVTRCMTSTT